MREQELRGWGLALYSAFLCGGGGGQAACPRAGVEELAGGAAGHAVASLAGLKRACMRDSSLWARCCQSSLGRVLEYLLLPCTLPFQYTYFQTRR